MTKEDRKPEAGDGGEKEPYEAPALTRHGTVVAITGTSAGKEAETGKEIETGKEFETGKEIKEKEGKEIL